MIRWLTLLFILYEANAACRNTFSPPYFECDTEMEAHIIMKRKISHPFYFEEEEDKEEEDRVITIHKLYKKRKLEVITDPYRGLDYDEINVYYIDLNKLNNMKVYDYRENLNEND